MRARALVAAIGLATIALAFVFAHPHATEGPVFRDFESYYAGGATWRYEGDPYSREVWRTERTIPGIVTTRDELLPFVGPPFGLPLWGLLSRLPWNAATLVWGCVLTASLLVLVGAGVALGANGLRSRPEIVVRVGAALVFAASFGPLTSGIALGQVAILACAALALVPFALRGRRTIAKSLFATLGAGLQPTIALAAAARVANVRSAVAIGGAALLALLGSELALGRYGGDAHYLQILGEHSAAERAIAIQTTVGAVARGFGASPQTAAACAIGLGLAAIAILIWQCRSRHYAPDDRLLLASLALPLVWPFAHEHDFAIAFVPALAIAARARGAVWYLGALATLAIGADWLGLAQRPDGALFECMRALGGAFALAAFRPGARFDARGLAPGAIALAILAVAPLAAAHPLPVWPDALPLNFHVPRTFDTAQTWGAEQVRAGVARFDVTNAALRALSLAGCLVLWIAGSTALRSREAAPSVTARV